MSLLSTVICFGLPLWLGFVILRCLKIRFSDDRYAYLGWMHVTGCLGIGIYLIAWLMLGLPLIESVAIPILLVCAWLHIWIRRRERSSYESRELESGSSAPPDESPSYQRTGFALILSGVLAYGALGMISASAHAVTSGDEIRHWTFKAKMIYSADGFGPDFIALANEAKRPKEFWAAWDEWLLEVWPTLDKDFKSRTPGPGTKWDYHLDYPLLNPLLHVWTYANAGKILHWQNRFLITSFTLSLILILAGALRTLTQPMPLIGGMLLITVIGMVETLQALKWSLADGMVAAGLLLTVDALRRFQGDRDPRWWWLMIIGLSVMVWSKNEGLLYLLCIVVGCASVKIKPTGTRLVTLAIPASIVLLTWMSNSRLGFSNDLATEGAAVSTQRVLALASYFWREIFSAPAWGMSSGDVHCNFLHCAFLGLLLLFPRISLNRSMRLITCTALCMIAGQILVYAITPHKLAWHLQESALRFVWQGISVIALWIAATTHQILQQD